MTFELKPSSEAQAIRAQLAKTESECAAYKQLGRALAERAALAQNRIDEAAALSALGRGKAGKDVAEAQRVLADIKLTMASEAANAATAQQKLEDLRAELGAAEFKPLIELQRELRSAFNDQIRKAIGATTALQAALVELRNLRSAAERLLPTDLVGPGGQTVAARGGVPQIGMLNFDYLAPGEDSAPLKSFKEAVMGYDRGLLAADDPIRKQWEHSEQQRRRKAEPVSEPGLSTIRIKPESAAERGAASSWGHSAAIVGELIGE